MDYMLTDLREDYPNWKDYFDIIIVSASKPRFFMSGTSLREVDLETGKLKFTKTPERFERGKVYAGGSFSLFKKWTGTQGTEVLYIGDNINHDITDTKKARCLWRTLLIVRELDHEIATWKRVKPKFEKLNALEYLRAKTYMHMDSSASEQPDASGKY
jgi:5'-nucleotidase